MASDFPLPRRDTVKPAPAVPRPTVLPATAADEVERARWNLVGFYSSVIKDAGSDEREHSEGFLKTLVRPAVEKVERALTIIRSDELATNSISDSIDEHLIKARLLIADLSFHPENVFLEVGGRRLTGRPYVLICRSQDGYPSNLANERIMFVDTHFGRYQSRLQDYIDELARRIKWALSPEGHRAHPIRSRFPDFRDYFE